MNKTYYLNLPQSNGNIEKWAKIREALSIEIVPCINPSKKIVIDFETTGLDVGTHGIDEPLEIAIIDGDGNVLINSLLKPYSKTNWKEAEQIHGITPTMVKKAPFFHEIVPRVLGILANTDTVIGYKTQFDLDVLRSLGVYWNCKIIDVMKLFRKLYWKETKDGQNKSLDFCASYYGYSCKDITHRSLEDAKRTLFCYDSILSGKVGVEMSAKNLFERYTPDLLKYFKENKCTEATPYTDDLEKKLLRSIHICSVTCCQLKSFISLFRPSMTKRELEAAWNGIVRTVKAAMAGTSVTNRAEKTTQPYGGYLNPKDMETLPIVLGDDYECSIEKENIEPSLIGLVVDYLSRISFGENKEDVFKISILGADIKDVIDENVNSTHHLQLYKWLDKIVGIDNASIKHACKAVQYDSLGRGNIFAEINSRLAPNKETCENIRHMLLRTKEFIKTYGPITDSGFTFEGGYSKIVSSGDGDLLTSDTIWDFKVSIHKPKKKHTLQLLMYYVMGIKCGKQEFKKIRRIGICNPRLNMVYIKNINNIPDDIIWKVHDDVLIYDV